MSMARIAAVQELSPAWQAGIRPGRGVVAVNSNPLRDYIDWLWYTDENEIELELDDASVMHLKRTAGVSWGIEFDGVIFDRVKTCHNNCIFCFMSMLPDGMRPALYLRDDDYRLSFLQGNFVTLTNMTDEDVNRVLEYNLSPLHVSLHAVTPAVREQLMGKNHARGIEVLEQLLDAGLEVYVQVVLVPGINDGDELEATLAWIERKTGIKQVGFVPYGYTKYATIQSSYASSEAAQKILTTLADYQEHTRSTSGHTRFMASDEFYCMAYPKTLLEHLPPAAHYDGYPQLEDGIGMLRIYVDAWRKLNPLSPKTLAAPIIIATGKAFAPVLQGLLCPLPRLDIEVLAIENRFFGGNVDVAGLITATDIIEQVKERARTRSTEGTRLVIADVMLNDDGLFLDNQTPVDLAATLNMQVDVVSCTAEALSAYLHELRLNN